LLLDVLADDAQRRTAAGRGEVGRGPQVPVHGVPVHPAGELRSQPPGRHALEAVHEPGHGNLRRVLHRRVHVVVFAVQLPQFGAKVCADLLHGVFAALEHVRVEHAAPVLHYEDHMDVKRGTTCLPRRQSSEIVIGQ
jgi:hypothetical protein